MLDESDLRKIEELKKHEKNSVNVYDKVHYREISPQSCAVWAVEKVTKFGFPLSFDEKASFLTLIFKVCEEELKYLKRKKN